MRFPEHLEPLLSPATRDVWDGIVGVVPPEAYLVGGTAVAAHLGHRPSQDLDFFLEAAVDLEALERSLGTLGELTVTRREPGALNGVLGGTVIQFLDASDQRLLEPTQEVAGLRVASIGDLLATKLHAVSGRPALRDYVDLQAIEERSWRFVEEGLALYVERYRPSVPDDAITTVLRALASFEDVPEDPTLEVNVNEVARYWTRRMREVTRHLDRWA